MSAAEDDWRRMGQETALPPGTRLLWTRYQARRIEWEHDHCVMCMAKFMDPEFSPEHAAYIREHPDVLVEGFTTAEASAQGAEYEWVCLECFKDFGVEFGWQAVGAAPI